MPYLQIDQRCTGCLACVINCPALALRFEDRGDRRLLFHSISRCVRCGNCWRICPQHAIDISGFLSESWEEAASIRILKCSVCGEPIFTQKAREILEGEDRELVLLCDRHKGMKAASLIARIPFREGGA